MIKHCIGIGPPLASNVDSKKLCSTCHIVNTCQAARICSRYAFGHHPRSCCTWTGHRSHVGFSPFLSYREESPTATIISPARNRLVLYSLLVIVASAHVHGIPVTFWFKAKFLHQAVCAWQIEFGFSANTAKGAPTIRQNLAAKAIFRYTYCIVLRFDPTHTWGCTQPRLRLPTHWLKPYEQPAAFEEVCSVVCERAVSGLWWRENPSE